jgi:hypothetical protein
MFRLKTITIAILAAGMLAATVWVCRAAPIVSRPVVSDEILSLTGLDTFRIEVDAKSTAPGEIKLSAERITADIEKMVAQRGFKTSEQEDAAKLSIMIRLHGSPKYPDVIVCRFHFSLEQDVIVTRLNKTLRLPTYALVHSSLTDKDDAAKDVDRQIELLVRLFLTRVKSANELKPSPGRG